MTMIVHEDHDIHGLIVNVFPDGSQTIDDDCECPPACPDCEAEGVLRMTQTTLVCPTCEDTGPFWACLIPTCPVVECSECGQRFHADTGDTGDTTCLADRPATRQ